MTATVRIGRRKFLRRALAFAGLGAWVWSRPLMACSGASVRTALFQKLHRMFDGQLGSVEGIGHVYLESLASLPSAHAMADALLADVPDLEGACLHADLEPFRTVLWQAIRRDFSAERTVELRGYVLSLTECRVGGVAALLGADRPAST